MSKIEAMTDRELLIQQSKDIESLCNAFKEFKESNAEEHKLIFEKLDILSEGKISNKLFFFTISFILIALVSLTAYTGTIKNDVIKNTVCIEKISEKK